jgi:hypothetical protein
MAPSKVLGTQAKTNATTTTTTGVVTRRGLATRQQNTIISNTHTEKQQPVLFKDTRIKRKAEASPLKDKMTKRSALGNITNVCSIIKTLYYNCTVMIIY